jgi:hypothetical protein
MAVSTILVVFIGHCILSYCLFALWVFLKTHTWTGATRPKWASLSHVPGPWVAKWTRFWIAKALWTGRSHQVWIETNAKYGLLARVGPKHVITDDPAITRRVLATRSRYDRGASFDSLRVDPLIPDIIGERDKKKHAMIKAMMAPSVRFPFHVSLCLFMLTRTCKSSPAAPSEPLSPLWTRRS